MRQSEKQMMINEYKKQFNYFLLSNGSERENNFLTGQKQMMKLFFSAKEINAIENSVRIQKEYLKGYFENLESWVRTIEKEQGEKELLFTWDNEGLQKLESHYDWAFSEYKGFKLAIDMAYERLQKAA